MANIAFNSLRLRACLEERQLALEEFALEVQLPIATLRDALAGERGLSFLQLRRIADYFGRGVLYFTDREGAPDDLGLSVNYRTLTNQKPGLSNVVRNLVRRVETQRQVFMDLLEERDDRHANDVQPPQLGAAELLPEFAERVRAWLQLRDERRTFAVYRSALEARGILVFRSNGYQGDWQLPAESKILGFSLFYERFPVIFIKKTDSDPQQVFTLMHELGHLLVHRSSVIDDEDDLESARVREVEANLFAGHVLLPGRLVHQSLGNQRYPGAPDQAAQWTKKVREQTGVSVEMVLRRCMDEGLLSQESYEQYRVYAANRPPLQPKAGGNRAYRHREPRHLFGDRFVRVVVDAVQEKTISPYKACTFLDGIKTQDLAKLETFLVRS